MKSQSLREETQWNSIYLKSARKLQKVLSQSLEDQCWFNVCPKLRVSLKSMRATKRTLIGISK